MSRFNNPKTPRVGPRSAITSEGEGTTYEGARGYTRAPKSELFLLAASFMGGDDNFYEKSDDRYNRLLDLLTRDSILDDPDWVMMLVNWLRNEANLRTVAMVTALEYVRLRVALGKTEPWFDMAGEEHTNRNIVGVALNRADEPAEAIAYYFAKHGKPLPQPIKNGIADAATRLYNQFSFIKYGESRSAAYTMKDVLRITHPEPKDVHQNVLFEYITSNDRDATLRLFSQRNTLNTLQLRKALYAMSPEERRTVDAYDLKRAGMTWESVSEWHPDGMTAEVWEKMIPNMGIMALIRNLRNFDQAGISSDSRRYVQSRIMDPVIVAESRQLPFRWYNAFRAVESLHYATALEEALDMSLANIPTFDGDTLVLVDMSGSMFGGMVSAKSNVSYANAASLFGAAIKLRNPEGVDLFQYGSEFGGLGMYVDSTMRRFSEYESDKRWTGVTKRIEISKGGSLLRAMDKFHDMGGTKTHQAVAETFDPKRHKRVILLTDEQSWNNRYDALPVPANVPVYIWNLAGYRVGTMPSGSHNRHLFGGLSDSAFKLIPILEAGRNTGWPWEVRENAGTH